MEIEKSGDENYKRDGNTEEVMKKMKAEEGSAVEHKMRKKIKKRYGREDDEEKN